MLENFFSEKVTYQSPLSPQEIEQKLNEVVETNFVIWRWFAFFFNSTYFGSVAIDGFSISRHRRRTRYITPTIKGRVEALAGGSLIKVTFKLNMFLRIFLAVWLSGLVLMGFMGLLGSIFSSTPSHDSPVVVIATMCVVFFISFFLPSMAFQWGVDKDKLFLQELFEAELVANE